MYKKEKLSNFDSEKGFVDVTAYLQNNKTNRKYTASYTRGAQGDEWTKDLNFYEVIPKKKAAKISWTEVFQDYDRNSTLHDGGLRKWLLLYYNPPTQKK